MGKKLRISVDLEVTNRCNAWCVMCPRDAVKRLGMMKREVFRRVLARCTEYGRVKNLSFAGLGEPLLHPRLVDWIRMAKERGLQTSVVTNGALLDEETARGLVQAGLDNLNVSIGGFTRETYEKVHRGLRHEMTRENLLRAIELAEGSRCKVNIHISPTAQTRRERDQILEFWKSRGIDYCFEFERPANRGGLVNTPEGTVVVNGPPNGDMRHGGHAISIDELLMPTYFERRQIVQESRFACSIKSLMTFIDWQGDIYLCCNDFRKQMIFGHVRTTSFEESNAAKDALELSRAPICQACNLLEADLTCRKPSFYLRLARYELSRRLRKLTRLAASF